MKPFHLAGDVDDQADDRRLPLENLPKVAIHPQKNLLIVRCHSGPSAFRCLCWLADSEFEAESLRDAPRKEEELGTRNCHWEFPKHSYHPGPLN